MKDSFKYHFIWMTVTFLAVAAVVLIALLASSK